MNHPPEAYGFRVTSDDGRVLVYTGDTGMCDYVVELARGADVLLSEASWTHSPDRPEGIHLSGTEAGQIAARRRRRRTSAHPHPAVDVPRGRHRRGQGRVLRTGARGVGRGRLRHLITASRPMQCRRRR